MDVGIGIGIGIGMGIGIGVGICTAMLAGCTPTLNWRMSRLDPNGAVVLFPCKPVIRDRAVVLAGMNAQVTMQSCDAGDGIFALSSTDLGDPGRVDAFLLGWQKSAAQNVDAVPRLIGATAVKGMTANSNATVSMLDGRTPDGARLTQELSFFVKGTRVFEAAVVAREWKQDAADTFFEGVSLP